MDIKIFITGIYRSGTTLVSRILNSHPNLWVTYDSVHFMRFSYDKYNPIDLVENAENLVKEVHARIFKRWNMNFNLAKVISCIYALKEINYRKIYELIMEDLALQYKGKVIGWGEKSNVCWGQIPNFLKMFPEGKAIHILRDPRDVMCSYREMTYEPGYAYLDSAFASLHSFISAKNYSKNLSSKNYYCLRYEELVNEPFETIKVLCGFLDIEFEQKMLDALNFIDKSGQRWTGDSSFDKDITEISKKPIGRWQRHALPVEAYFIEMINRPVMHEFNYSMAGFELNKEEWNKLYNILQDPIIKTRYQHWLKTGEGVEAYPSDPLIKG